MIFPNFPNFLKFFTLKILHWQDFFITFVRYEENPCNTTDFFYLRNGNSADRTLYRFRRKIVSRGATR